MIDVSVIVVSYNARELLDDCIASVIGENGDVRKALSVEVVVADNASTDGSADHVRTHWIERGAPVQLIEMTDNRGFAAGNNEGFKVARGRYLLLLNSDARMLPGALEKLVEYAELHPTCGQVAPRLLNADLTLQRSARGFPSPWNLATEYLYFRRLFPRSRRFNDFYKGWFGHDDVLDNNGFLMGACLLVPRTALDRVGAMDESYFMFNEETDWARRFIDAGLTVTFLPTAECIHLGGGSTRKEWNRMYKSQVEGNLRYLVYHDGERSARRAQRVMKWALRMRAVLYGAAGRLPIGSVAARQARRQRGEAFAMAGRHIARVDVTAFGEPQVPSLS